MSMLEGLGEKGWFRRLIWAAVGLQVALLAAQLVVAVLMAPYSQNFNETPLGTLFSALMMLTFPVMGLIIFTRRPNHPIGWLFCVTQVGWTMNNFASAFGLYALRARPDLLPTANALVWLYTWPGVLSQGLLFYLLLLFPDGRLLSPRWRAMAWLVTLWMVICMIGVAFAPGPVDTSGVLPLTNPLGVKGGLGRVFEWISFNGTAAFLPLTILTALSLVLRFRFARGQTRQQIKWLAVAIVIVALLWAVAFALMARYPTTATTPLWAVIAENVAIFSEVVIPITAGIAILRYRLYEIDRIINQALVYFSLTAALAVVYFGSILILQALLNALTGEGQSSIATVISTLGIAALFTPLRRRFQSLIDRRFYRKKYNAQLILDTFSGVVRNEVDLQLMSDQLLAVIEETFQPNVTALWINKK